MVCCTPGIADVVPAGDMTHDVQQGQLHLCSANALTLTLCMVQEQLHTQAQ